MQEIKKIVLVLLIPALLGCSHNQLKQLQQEVDNISATYVPDKRTGISDAKLRKHNKNSLVITGETLFPEAKGEILEWVNNAGYQVVDSMIVLPGPEIGEKTTGLVSVSVANIKSRPSHYADLSTQAVMGTPVRIIKRHSGWWLIQTPDNYLGWVTTSSVSTLTPAEMKSWKMAYRLIFSGMHGEIFKDSDKKEVVGDLVAGAIIELETHSGGMLKVKLPDGREGFVDQEYFYPFKQWADTVTARQETVSPIASKFTGLPYMWGGTSSKALDCSGFTKTVYFLNGLILERDASQQIRHGIPINPDEEFKNLQPGDLLFYGTKEPFRVVHVGVWTPNQAVIHASGRVKEESMIPGSAHFSDYLHNTFLGEVRRIIGAPAGYGIWTVKDHPWYFETGD